MPTTQSAVRFQFAGVDAHIDPANRTVFMIISGEYDGTRRGDVGIAPYEHDGSAGGNYAAAVSLDGSWAMTMAMKITRQPRSSLALSA